MAGAQLVVRWSPHSGEDPENQRFVRINGSQHDLSYYSVHSTKHDKFSFKLLARHSKIPYVQCLDWSPTDEDLIIIGASSGEALLLRPSDINTAATPLPIKHQRSCNDVSFNSNGTLVAQGLDKVRNDFCLNIWDVNERMSHSRHTSGHDVARPSRQLASGESIHSVKFTRDNPNTMLCGAALRYLRLYDLRESPSNPAFTCHSRCILGITLDRDPNYFASYADDGTIAVWDRRVARMNTAAEPVLNFAPSMNDEFGRSSITSMRYSPVRTGMLAASTASGVVRVWETAKLSDQDSLHHSPSLSQLNSDAGVEVHKSRIGGWRDSAANLLEASRAYGGTSTSGTRTPNPRAYDSFETLLVHRAKDLVSPLRNTKGVVERRIVGFDWIVEGNSTSPARLIAITSEGAMDVLKCPGPVPSIAWGSRNQFATTCDRDLHYMPAPSTKAGIDHEKARSGGKSISDLDEYDDGGFWSESPDQRLGLLEKRRRERSNSVVKPEDFLPEPHEVLRNDISVTMRKRVEAGYRMSCAKNAKLTKREDRYLEDMWIWLDGAQECAKDQGMMSGMLDLSFLGVNPIWRGVRDPVPSSRVHSDLTPRFNDWNSTVAAINRKCGRKAFVNCRTDFPEQRRLGLAICGWNYEGEELEQELGRLEEIGNYSKAAGWALFHGDIDRSIRCLQKGGQQMKLMSAAVAGYYAESKTNAPNSTWKTLASEMATELDDPYLRAIFAYVANSEWEEVLDQIGLPLRERIGIALRWLEDEKLTNFLEEATKAVIDNGDLDGIILTGVTEQAVALLQVYINRTADVQTAALVASFGCPKYFKDERVEYWVESYRNLLNSWQMFHARARFDVARGKASKDRHGNMVLEAPQKQVYVRCANCDKSISHSAARKGQLKKYPQSMASRDKQVSSVAGGGPKLTVCPHCKKSLPRCAVCLLYLGTIYYKPGTDEKNVNAEKDYDRWFNFCLSCNHGMHAGHAKEWFANHRICPVPECDCACKM